MKRFLALVLTVVALLTVLPACGGGNQFKELEGKWTCFKDESIDGKYSDAVLKATYRQITVEIKSNGEFEYKIGETSWSGTVESYKSDDDRWVVLNTNKKNGEPAENPDFLVYYEHDGKDIFVLTSYIKESDIAGKSYVYFEK